jgi:hypothetical protein
MSIALPISSLSIGFELATLGDVAPLTVRHLLPTAVALPLADGEALSTDSLYVSVLTNRRPVKTLDEAASAADCFVAIYGDSSIRFWDCADVARPLYETVLPGTSAGQV